MKKTKLLKVAQPKLLKVGTPISFRPFELVPKSVEKTKFTLQEINGKLKLTEPQEKYYLYLPNLKKFVGCRYFTATVFSEYYPADFDYATCYNELTGVKHALFWLRKKVPINNKPLLIGQKIRIIKVIRHSFIAKMSGKKTYQI